MVTAFLENNATLYHTLFLFLFPACGFCKKKGPRTQPNIEMDCVRAFWMGMAGRVCLAGRFQDYFFLLAGFSQPNGVLGVLFGDFVPMWILTLGAHYLPSIKIWIRNNIVVM